MEFAPIESWFEGSKRPMLISGPCSAETEEQVLDTARQLKATGKIDVLRAGIWKPRTRPNSFEGVGSVGLKWLQAAKKETGLPIAVEVANTKHVYEALRHGVDILWIGARTTVNPFAVQEIADALDGVDATVLVKNPINPDVALWLGGIERMYNVGIRKIGAIHRGFSRYGEKQFRNAPQWRLPIELKTKFPTLPMICDPSHICGNRTGLAAISQKALDLNFDGLMLESHVQPERALSDAKQQVTPEDYKKILQSLVIRHVAADAEEANTLQSLRNQINDVDDELLRLLGERMGIASKIGEFKLKNDITILQTTRWSEILDKSVAKGKTVGLSEKFITRYLEAIHSESIDHQTKVMNK